MKIRYLGKLYNTEAKNRKVEIEEHINHGYHGDIYSFIADNGDKICFQYSKFTNFEHLAFVSTWGDEIKYFGCKETKNGVVVVQENIGIP